MFIRNICSYIEPHGVVIFFIVTAVKTTGLAYEIGFCDFCHGHFLNFVHQFIKSFFLSYKLLNCCCFHFGISSTICQDLRVYFSASRISCSVSQQFKTSLILISRYFEELFLLCALQNRWKSYQDRNTAKSEYDDAVWLFVRTNISDGHIAPIFCVKRLSLPESPLTTVSVYIYIYTSRPHVKHEGQ
jgi:hypothetical protein